MLRKATALVLLFIFLTGTTGFSLTLHFCTHSGAEYIGSFGIPAHDCKKERIQKNDENCCHAPVPESPVRSCCSPVHTKPETSCKETGHKPEHSCCDDSHALLKVKNLAKTQPVSTLPVLFPVALPTFQVSVPTDIIEDPSFIFPDAHPPDDYDPDLCVLNSVFRI